MVIMSSCFTGDNGITNFAVFSRASRNCSERQELITESYPGHILHKYNGPIRGSYLLFIIIAILCPKEAFSYCKCSTYHTQALSELEKCSKGATPVYCFHRETSKIYVRFTGCSDCYPAKPPYVSPVPMPPLVSGPNPTPGLSRNSTAKPPCSCTKYYPRIPSDCFNNGGATLCTRNGKLYWTGRLEPKQYGGQLDPTCPDVPETCWITSDTNLKLPYNKTDANWSEIVPNSSLVPNE